MFSVHNPAYIDLILTSQIDLFSNSNTCEVGISDHHDLVSKQCLTKKFREAVSKLSFIEIIRSLKKINWRGI